MEAATKATQAGGCGLSNLAVSVRGLGKSYVIAHQENATLASEALMAKLRNPFGRLSHETFWALSDVSFDVERGDVVGIIGRNGAGKSTLLKVLSRITTPTTGEVRIFGRVGSLLEVGTGFHPELTGRENIFLNGSILGMRRSEIQRQFDAIVDFAEVEQFLDTPVKRYSSGMYVRLAFAVAAHLNPEILIVDEVLAVGDAQFQAKCLGKMKDVSQQEGRTVLFVSHNMLAVQTLCQTAIFMQGGIVVEAGQARPILERYLQGHVNRIEHFPVTRAVDGSFQLKDFWFEGERPGEVPVSGKRLTFSFAVEGTIKPGVSFEVAVKSNLGSFVTLLNSHISGHCFPLLVGSNVVQCEVRCQLAPAVYDLEVKVLKGESAHLVEGTELVRVEIPQGLTVEEADFYGSGKLPLQPWAGVFFTPQSWGLSEVD